MKTQKNNSGPFSHDDDEQSSSQQHFCNMNNNEIKLISHQCQHAVEEKRDDDSNSEEDQSFPINNRNVHKIKTTMSNQ